MPKLLSMVGKSSAEGTAGGFKKGAEDGTGGTVTHEPRLDRAQGQVGPGVGTPMLRCSQSPMCDSKAGRGRTSPREGSSGRSGAEDPSAGQLRLAAREGLG